MAKAKKTEVFFIVDGKHIEAQACLLAPTLKRHLTKSQHPVAYVREDYIDQIGEFTSQVLSESGVEIRTIPDTDGGHAPWATPYPHGNKILAAAVPRDCDISVFLDTDMILKKKVNFASLLKKSDIGAVVSDYGASVESEDDWTHIYNLFGLDLPSERVTLLGGRELTSLPYFNGGMVIFRERTTDNQPTNIGAQWLEIALELEAKATCAYDRVNIDQISLPLLGYSRGSPVASIDQGLNFNIQAHGAGTDRKPSIIHYHRLGVLWGHQEHGQDALEAIVEVTDETAPMQFLTNFSDFARRQRMKRLLTDQGLLAV